MKNKWIETKPFEMEDGPRHWDMIKKKCGVQFTIDENLLLQFIFDLNLGKIQEDVEEITD